MANVPYTLHRFLLPTIEWRQLHQSPNLQRRHAAGTPYTRKGDREGRHHTFTCCLPKQGWRKTLCLQRPYGSPGLLWILKEGDSLDLHQAQSCPSTPARLLLCPWHAASGPQGMSWGATHFLCSPPVGLMSLRLSLTLLPSSIAEFPEVLSSL